MAASEAQSDEVPQQQSPKRRSMLTLVRNVAIVVFLCALIATQIYPTSEKRYQQEEQGEKPSIEINEEDKVDQEEPRNLMNSAKNIRVNNRGARGTFPELTTVQVDPDSDELKSRISRRLKGGKGGKGGMMGSKSKSKSKSKNGSRSSSDTFSPFPTQTPFPTATPFPTITPVPTETPLPSFTPLPTQTPFPSWTPFPTERSDTVAPTTSTTVAPTTTTTVAPSPAASFATTAPSPAASLVTVAPTTSA